jgi:hypothetical protein
MLPEAPIRLFELLSGLLQTETATQAMVQQRLKSFTTATAPAQTRFGRTYLTLGGEFFQLTATFEGAVLHLYQITLRVTPPAYATIWAFARALPAAEPTLSGAAEWQNSWLGLLPRLLLRPVAGKPGLSARFVGLLPAKKVVVLTQLRPRPA